jgi:hypothetical protein
MLYVGWLLAVGCLVFGVWSKINGWNKVFGQADEYKKVVSSHPMHDNLARRIMEESKISNQ